MEGFDTMKTNRITMKRCECGNPREKGADACPRCLSLEKGGYDARRAVSCGVPEPVGERDARRIRRALNKWLDDRGLNNK